MLVPLGRVRQSIDILHKNFYDYHRGSSVSLSTNEMQSSPRCHQLIQLIEDSCTIIQAIFVRLIFILSTILTVWRLVEETKQVYYWYLLLLLIFLLIESYSTVYKRKGYEYKWFCPSAFAYLIAIVPGIWLLELNQSVHPPLLSTVNQTRNVLTMQRRLEYLTRDHRLENGRKRALSTIGTAMKKPDLTLEELLKTPQEIMLKLNTHLTKDEWHMIIEQTTLLVLILSRWLLPKGELSREELSQLLLVYIGIAADINEFFEIFKETRVREDTTLRILVLLFWTLSLLQFCLAFTISRGRKSRLDFKLREERRFFCSPSDFWGMLMSLFLQDIPFFTFRAVLIFHYRILSYSTVFFTSKNGLIIILQWYRISVILAATISQERRNHRVQQRKLFQIRPTNGATLKTSEISPEKEENKINLPV